jgi:trk system potassium uptake protein TrkH
MTFFTPDLVTAATSVVATLGNIGPGLNAVGATQNYAGISATGQMILSACMLLGRLELYTVLILFLPSFWKR